MKNIKLILPIVLFLGVSVFFFKGLFSDPKNIENVQVKQSFPAFKLHDLMDSDRYYDESSIKGQVTLVNLWGTWCITCRIELPFLTQLKQKGVRVVGIYYDNAADSVFGDVDINNTRREVTKMLNQLGNPFEFNVYDGKRDLTLDLGVTAAPESFLVDADGTIVWHRRGEINERIWQQELGPLYQSLLSKVENKVEK